jgi:hypothetical protein
MGTTTKRWANATARLLRGLLMLVVTGGEARLFG